MALVRFWWLTCRIVRVEGAEHLDAALASGPVVPVYWHQHQLFCVRHLLLRRRPGQRLAFAISPSVDGEIPALLARWVGARPLRGSSTYDGARALKDYLDVVREGYSFSKEAMVIWTMMMSTSLIKRGIRINCTMPGPTQTPMMAHFEAATKASVLEAATQPSNRRSTPDEQAAPLVFLNSHVASYLNGVALAVDGGLLGGIATGQIDPRTLMGPAA